MEGRMPLELKDENRESMMSLDTRSAMYPEHAEYINDVPRHEKRHVSRAC
jgi:hypothetical protein